MTDDEHAARPPVPSEQLRDFYDLGERAWTEYLRTGIATPAEVVFARMDAMVENRRAALLAGVVKGPNAGAEVPAVSADLEPIRDVARGAEASRRAGPTKSG